MNNGVRFVGITVRMGDKDIVIPPLTFRQLKDKTLQEEMKKMGSIGSSPTEEQLDAARNVIYACIKRNYSDLDVDVLDDMITMGNLKDCMRAIFGMDVMPGELEASQPRQQTGTTSIAS